MIKYIQASEIAQSVFVKNQLQYSSLENFNSSILSLQVSESDQTKFNHLSIMKIKI